MVGKELKVLAMYLPQFHRTPENDAWWGEGFTDWVAVKNAKKRFFVLVFFFGLVYNTHGQTVRRPALGVLLDW